MDRGNRSLVLGTAGHIDHGKTALVRALTGVDCDRLPEEKARGITIELGFAPLDVGGVRISVVDVPGHEGLVRTMVSGATGIDLVLLVVAADEGAMPQTREHLAICELLGLSRGVVALTKCDLVDAEMAELAAEEVRALLAPTPLAALPIVRVSARTGEGLAELRDALAAEIAAAPARTPRDGPPRLAIDRAFEVRGFGPVATGTLIGFALTVGDALELHPSGLCGRVRGLESHGVRRERAEPGARTAVNVQGIPLDALARGRLLAPPGALAPTVTLDVELRSIADAPLEALASVELLCGTAERRARVGPIGAAIPPGGSGLARIHIEGEPLALLPGDRFILRGFARSAQAGATLGGGRVLDVAPPRRRRSDPTLVAELEALRHGDTARGLRVRIERAELVQEGDLARRPAHRAALSGAQQQLATQLCAELAVAALEPPSLRDLTAKTGAEPQRLVDLLTHLEREGRVVRAPGELWFDASAVESLRARIREHFRREPTLDTARYKALIGTSRRSAVPLMELFDMERLTARRGDVRVLRAR